MGEGTVFQIPILIEGQESTEDLKDKVREKDPAYAWVLKYTVPGAQHNLVSQKPVLKEMNSAGLGWAS